MSTTNRDERRALFTPAVESRGVRIERRSDDEGKPVDVAVGYAAVFYNAADARTTYELWEDYEERVLPGAFDRALREAQDVRALFNHEMSEILGRTKAGTCRLSVDAVGLRYEIDLPATAHGERVATAIRRGDLDGSSFSFRPVSTVWREEGEKFIRELVDVDLFDVGPVTFPAYQATTAGLRSAGSTLREQLVAEAETALRGDSDRSAAAVEVEYRFREVQQRQAGRD